MVEIKSGTAKSCVAPGNCPPGNNLIAIFGRSGGIWTSSEDNYAEVAGGRGTRPDCRNNVRHSQSVVIVEHEGAKRCTLGGVRDLRGNRRAFTTSAQLTAPIELHSLLHHGCNQGDHDQST